MFEYMLILIINPSFLKDLAGSPNKSAYYTWKTDGVGSGSPSVHHSYSHAGGGGMVFSGGGGGSVYSTGGGAVSPSHGHSYAQQVSFKPVFKIQSVN